MEKLILNLEKFDITYSVINDKSIVIKQSLNHQVFVNIENGRVVISDLLKPYNLVTGVITMPIKKALINGTILMGSYGLYTIIQDLYELYTPPIEFIIIFLVLYCLNFFYYYLRYLQLKTKIMDWLS